MYFFLVNIVCSILQVVTMGAAQSQESHTLEFSSSTGESAAAVCKNNGAIVGLQTYNVGDNFNLTIWCAPPAALSLTPTQSPPTVQWRPAVSNWLFCLPGTYMAAINATVVTPPPRRNRPPVVWWFACRALPPTYKPVNCSGISGELWAQSNFTEVVLPAGHIIQQITSRRRRRIDYWKIISCPVIRTACSLPTIPNGVVTTEPPSSDSGLVPLGTTLTASCRLGHELDGPSNSTCGGGDVEWGELPYCVSIQEDELDILFSSLGGPVLLPCPSDRSTSLEYMWSVLPEHLYEVMEVALDNISYVLLQNGSLLITNVTLYDEGTYYCGVTDGVDMVSYKLHLKSTQLSSPPVLVDFQPHYYTTAGSPAVLDCKMLGHPVPRIQWLNSADFQPLSRDPQDRVHFAVNGSLFFNPARFEDTGTFYCKGQNKVDLVIASAVLFVSPSGP